MKYFPDLVYQIKYSSEWQAFVGSLTKIFKIMIGSLENLRIGYKQVRIAALRSVLIFSTQFEQLWCIETLKTGYWAIFERFWDLQDLFRGHPNPSNGLKEVRPDAPTPVSTFFQVIWTVWIIGIHKTPFCALFYRFWALHDPSGGHPTPAMGSNRSCCCPHTS